ncbi:MAG: phage integrase SAM-like domain-containing protein [Candidatus Glassbacteria bacterium]
MERHGKNQSRSMAARYNDFFKNVKRCPESLETQLSQISKKLVLDYMHARMKQEGVKAATANREAAFLREMLSRAVEWDIL